MTDQTTTQPVEDGDFEFDPSKTEGYVSLGNNEWAQIDDEHGGELWFTQSHQDKFGCGDEKIDWDDEEYRDEDGNIVESLQEDFDDGYRWLVNIILIEWTIVNEKGLEIRDSDEADVMKVNDMPPEALYAAGCKVMSWG